MRLWTVFFLSLVGMFLLDQGIKDLFVNGLDWQHRCLSLELHYNTGVAFSLFTFLGSWLKWLQAGLILAITVYLLVGGLIRQHPLALGLLLGAALSNLYDRFIHLGVVDYFAWHCGFNYAVFNLADVVIDGTIAWLLFQSYRAYRREKKT